MNIEKEILEIKKAQSENGAMMKLILQKLCPKTDLLTPKEVESITGYSRSTLSRWAKSGKITSEKGNGNRKYKLTEINQIINK